MSPDRRGLSLCCCEDAGRACVATGVRRHDAGVEVAAGIPAAGGHALFAATDVTVQSHVAARVRAAAHSRRIVASARTPSRNIAASTSPTSAYCTMNPAVIAASTRATWGAGTSRVIRPWSW